MTPEIRLAESFMQEMTLSRSEEIIKDTPRRSQLSSSSSDTESDADAEKNQRPVLKLNLEGIGTPNHDKQDRTEVLPSPKKKPEETDLAKDGLGELFKKLFTVEEPVNPNGDDEKQSPEPKEKQGLSGFSNILNAITKFAMSQPAQQVKEYDPDASPPDVAFAKQHAVALVNNVGCVLCQKLQRVQAHEFGRETKCSGSCLSLLHTRPTSSTVQLVH